MTLEEVHMLCNELGFSSPDETLAFIEKASPEEIEAVIERRKKKMRKWLTEGSYVYVYAS